MATLYVQGANGLIEYGNVTAEKITEALGYTPASTEAITENIQAFCGDLVNGVDAEGNELKVAYAAEADIASNVASSREFVSATRYLPVLNTSSGNAAVKANEALYTYGYPTGDGTAGSLYFNVGSSKIMGGISIHNNNGQITNLVANQSSTLRTITLPDSSGTVITTGNFPVADEDTVGGVKVKLNGTELIISTV
jgi:hypothetical protein